MVFILVVLTMVCLSLSGCSPASTQTSHLQAVPAAEQSAPPAIPEALSPDAILRELRMREGRIQISDMELLGLDSSALRRMPGEQLLQLFKSRITSIYGKDDREDVYAQSDRSILRLADSTIALFDSNYVEPDGENVPPSNYKLLTKRFGDLYNLCSDERFRDQPTGSYGSGVLVGPDLVLTAGHCVDKTKHPLSHIRFVFGFRMRDAKAANLLIPSRDVYHGKEIVGFVEGNNGSDWAVVRLEHRVEGHTPLPIGRFDLASSEVTKRKVPDKTSVFAIGYPCGLPEKYCPNATIQTNDEKQPFFLANLDTYGGNSGCPVFANLDGKYEVVGTLVRGLEDFNFVSAGPRKCRASLRYLDNQAGEICTRTSEYARLIPALP